MSVGHWARPAWLGFRAAGGTRLPFICNRASLLQTGGLHPLCERRPAAETPFAGPGPPGSKGLQCVTRSGR